jgi:hypothetical protein
LYTYPFNHTPDYKKEASPLIVTVEEPVSQLTFYTAPPIAIPQQKCVIKANRKHYKNILD